VGAGFNAGLIFGELSPIFTVGGKSCSLTLMGKVESFLTNRTHGTISIVFTK